LTLLAGDELYFRGHRAVELADRHSPETVAHLLWSGELAERPPFRSGEQQVALARSLMVALPPSARMADRLRVGVVGLSAADPLRFDLSPGVIARTAGELIGTLVDALPAAGGSTAGTARTDPGRSIGRRLWPALSSHPEPPGLLDAALVLLADHELAVSTLAARVAASARAHPYAVVSAALGAMDARYHGGASAQADRFLTEALADPVAALAEQLRSGEQVRGFGHRIYRARDPRAEHLLAALRRRPEAEAVMAAVDAVTARLDPERGQFPNVDLALAALAHTYGMGPDAGAGIFSVARIAGWVGHALEEYREPLPRMRVHAEYTGPHPDG
jgi:citrate synthase